MASINSALIGEYSAEFLKAFSEPEKFMRTYKVPPMFLRAMADAYDMPGEPQMRIHSTDGKRTWVQFDSPEGQIVVALNDDGQLCGNTRTSSGAFLKLNFATNPLVCKAAWLLILYSLETSGTGKEMVSAREFLHDEVSEKTWEEIEKKWNADPAWKQQFAGSIFDLYTYARGFVSVNRFGKIPATGLLQNLPRADQESFFSPFEEAKAVAKREEKGLPVNEEDYNLAAKLKIAFTEEEKARIPKKEDWFVMPDEGYEIMDEINNSMAFRNYWLIGKAGTGKTELAKQIAAWLGLPYVFVNCGSGFDDAKIRGQFIPNPDAGTPANPELVAYVNALTDIDLELRADEIAEKIRAKSSSPKALMMRCAEILSSDSSKRPEFLWQDSPIVYAYSRPCVCEIQEADCIRDPGVLTNFNSILECGDNKFIQLDNGKILRKNPYCIYIFTSNMQYEGCRMINNAVFDRLDPYRLELPDAKTRATRISKKTGFADKKALKTMVSVVDKIDNYMTENGLMTGVCGMRSLEHWAEALMIWQRRHPGEEIPSKVLRDTGARKVLAKTAQPEDELNEIKKIWFGLFPDEG